MGRIIIFNSLMIIVMLIVTEILFRVIFNIIGYPFFKPGDYLEKNYYPELLKVQNANVQPSDDGINVLILGGSVVSPNYSNPERRLDSLFKKIYPHLKQVNIYNVAVPGHTSRDNMIKYGKLANKKFDLVIYYEAINEVRANNIPTEDFNANYNHIRWYNEINRLNSHTEINYTIIPFAVDFLFYQFYSQVQPKKYITLEEIKEEFLIFGDNIKTKLPYHENLLRIKKSAQQKKENLLFLKYASYFPEVSLDGSPNDKQYFSSCYGFSHALTWGKVENIKQGIKVHNEMLTNVAHGENIFLYDLASEMPKHKNMFCDFCHLSELGAKIFYNKLVEFIDENDLLNIRKVKN